MNTKLTGKEFKGMAGAFAAMFTPFDKKGALNEEAIDQLVEYGIREGLKGFYLTGSTGEGMLLTNEERVRVYRRAVKAAIAVVADTSATGGGADITEPKPQVFTTDDGRKLIINGTINRNVNPEALEFFMEKEHPELKERLGRAFYPKWELSKKEWDRLSDEERALLMGEMVVTENIGTAKLTVK